ncbi:TraB/GumN family protein [Oceanobacillus alkalisoli]|uniref:TraB/GumN family protein n=1 Tax=Oceanobacillus alkalisoli TaxID=2925113 RepID=UPI001EE4439F|nr:TraB/GumN family protein [Oceanobacillus alkalisoli]MCG5103340.1 TraB/GumN family protein [Oceanobacillus alkalisoli]
MRKILLTLMIIITVLFGCQNSATEERNDGGFLWKVENEDTTVYLQGTIHVGNEDFFPLNEQIEDAYEESDVVLPEINLNELDVMESQSLMMDLAMYEEGQTLADDLTEDTFVALEEILKENDMGIEMVQQFKPWFMEMLLMQFALEESEYSPEYAVDQYFLDRADEDEKEIRELETYEDQLMVLSGFSEELQLEMLEDAILNYDEMVEDLDEITAYWLNGATDELSASGEDEESIEGYEEYMEEMNTNRNIGMADTILEILTEDSGQTYFVFVGAMHMVEDPSIVSLIEEDGYKVEHIY